MKRKLLSVLTGLVLVFSMLGIGGMNAQESSFNLEVTPGCGFNMLSWDEVAGATQYFIYRGFGAGEEFETPLLDFPIMETSFKDEINIKDGQEYCYYVTALGADAAEFARSNEACAVPSCYTEPDPDECKLVLRYQQDNVMYFANGEQKGPMDTPPVNVNSRLFLVVRYVTEEIPGTMLEWVGTSKTVVVTTRDGTRIELQIGNKDAKINGEVIQIDPNNPEVVPFIENGRTLLPMRFVAENLGATGPDDIRWYGDTKTVELRFDDPECGKCEWIAGRVLEKEKTYYLASVTQDSFFDVFVELCGGKKRIIYLKDDLKAENSKDMLSAYSGNANFCFRESGDLAKWEAFPQDEDICEEEIMPEQVCVCIQVENKECSDEGILVMGKTCTGIDYVVSLPQTDSDTCSQIQVGRCYEFCGVMTFTLADRKLLPAESFTEVDCPCPCEGCTWIIGEITDVQSFVTGSMRIYAVSVETCEDGPQTYSASSNMTDMLEGIEISDFEGCANICINQDGVIVRWIALPDLADCCSDEEPPPPERIIECICLEIVRGDCRNFNGIDPEGKMWNLGFSENPDLCDEIEIGRFYEFCGEVTRITHEGLGLTGISMQVTSVTPQEEPCETNCNWIKGEINATMSKTGSYTSVFISECGGWDRILTTRNNHYDIGRTQTIETYTGCASFCLEEDDKTIRMWRIEDEDCCPDSTCVEITIERVNCDSALPVVYGTSTSNEEDVYRLNLTDPTLCEELSEGMCISACGFITEETEDRTVIQTKNIRIITCPPSDTITGCMCIQVVSSDCTSDPLTVNAVDIYRNDVFLTFEADRTTFCERFTEGSYWEVCGEFTYTRGPDSTAIPHIAVESALPLDSPCTAMCTYIQIDNITTLEDPTESFATGHDLSYTRWTLHFDDDPTLVDSLVPGNCYTVCGNRTSPGEYEVRISGEEEMDVISVTPVECVELPPYTCLCLEIDTVDTSTTPPTVNAVSGTYGIPIPITLNLEDMEPTSYEEIAEGQFWEVCGTIAMYRTGETEIRVMEMTEREEPCEIRIPGCLCITITSTGSRIRGFDRTGHTWSVMMANGDSILNPDIEVGECWRFCGFRTPIDAGDETRIIMGNEFYMISSEEVECPCAEPERECFTGEIEFIQCGIGAGDAGTMLVIRISAGNRKMVYIPAELGIICSDLVEGTCVRVCGTASVPGSPLVILDEFTIVDCE